MQRQAAISLRFREELGLRTERPRQRPGKCECKEMLLFSSGGWVMEIRALDFLVDLTGMNLPTEF
jgi:hypothetical protein